MSAKYRAKIRSEIQIRSADSASKIRQRLVAFFFPPIQYAVFISHNVQRIHTFFPTINLSEPDTMRQQSHWRYLSATEEMQPSVSFGKQNVQQTYFFRSFFMSCFQTPQTNTFQWT